MINFSLYNDGIDQIDDRTNRALVSEESSVVEFVELSDSNSGIIITQYFKVHNDYCRFCNFQLNCNFQKYDQAQVQQHG